MMTGPSPLSRLVGDGPRPMKVIEFPGERGKETGTSVGIWNLRDNETRQARIDAIKFLQDVCKLTELHLAYNPTLGEDEQKTQLLFRALRDPQTPIRAFAQSPAELREHLTPDEREALFAAYLEFVDERSPIKRLTDKEVEELCSALGKESTTTTTLSSYDSASLKNIVRELANQLTKLTKRLSLDTSSAIETSPLAKIPALTGE